DVNLLDTHTVTFTAGRNDYVGTFSLDPITQDSTNGQTGSVVWHFSVSDHVEDSLAAGQTLTQTYTVKVADNNGDFATQNVTITITGSNEAPVITSTAQTGAVTEDTNIDNSGNLNAGGTIAFTDVNLTDTHTVSASASTFAWAGGTLTAAQQAALTAASTFTPTLTHDATGSTGTVGWTFSVSDNAVD